MIDEFLQQWGFVAPGLIASIATGAAAGAVGSVMVVRGSALLGDAAGHAALPGVCAAWLITGSSSIPVLLTGALVGAWLAGQGIAAIASRRRTRPDAAVAALLATAFGLGAVLFGVAQNRPGVAAAGLNSFLLGNAAAVTAPQSAWVVVACLALCSALVLFWRPLVVASFDPAYARTLGIDVARVGRWSNVAVALTVVIAVRALGVVMVAAMLVVPAVAARLVTTSLGQATALAAAIGASAGLVGVGVSIGINGVSTGPAMVLSSGVALATAAAFSRPRRRAES